MTVEYWKFRRPFYLDAAQLKKEDILGRLDLEGEKTVLAPGMHNITPDGYSSTYEVQVWEQDGDTVGAIIKTRGAGIKVMVRFDSRAGGEYIYSYGPVDRVPIRPTSPPMLLFRLSEIKPGKPSDILRIDGAVVYTAPDK